MPESPAPADAASPPDPVTRGRAALRKQQFEEAMSCFNEAIATNPLSVEANEGAATVAYLQRDFEAAGRFFEAAARADARRAEPLINLGAVQNRLKQHPLAIKTLQKALSRDRKNSDAYFNLAVAYRGAGQPTMAMNAYKEAIRLRSDFAEAHQNLGLVYLEIGNSRQAKTSLQRALELCPTLERAKRGLAKANAANNGNALRNPFGRLVEPIMDAPAVTAGRIALSESARSEDRAVITDLAGRLQRSLEAMLAEVRSETEPACHQTCRHMGSPTKPAEYRRTAERLRETLQRGGHLLDLVDEHIAALQRHEAKIGKQLESPDR